jgi:glycosyltransferase involved in cell wall biosynthesis
VADEKPSLLIAKGIISRMGGAERDLLRRLPHLTKWYDVSVATLSSCSELEEICKTNNIHLFKPENKWIPNYSSSSQIFDKIHTSSKKAWLSCNDLIERLDKFDNFHIVSGDGYLGMLDIIPKAKKSHLYLLEPHRGFHEDSLHRNLNGKFLRPKFITNLLLSKGRKNDIRIVKQFSKNNNSIISGNSSYTSQRIEDVYGIKCNFIHPCVDREEYTDNTQQTTNPYIEAKEVEYVVTIGTANWAKGSMEAISMLSGTNISLVHVGGGSDAEIKTLQEHASTKKVKLWVAPRLSSQQLSSLMKDSLAIISMAHKEPFGLTPIEAFSIGTPAIFVDDGGFRDSIIDGECGRLLPRHDYSKWHEALNQCRDKNLREKWATAGRNRIIDLKLSPQEQAEKIHKLFQSQ